MRLSATPQDDYYFSGWGGDCGPGNPLMGTTDIVLDSDQTCIATFLPRETALLSLVVLGDGVVSESTAGLACETRAGSTQTLCTQSYAVGATITLIPNAKSGSQFESWGKL